MVPVPDLVKLPRKLIKLPPTLVPEPKFTALAVVDVRLKLPFTVTMPVAAVVPTSKFSCPVPEMLRSLVAKVPFALAAAALPAMVKVPPDKVVLPVTVNDPAAALAELETITLPLLWV